MHSCRIPAPSFPDARQQAFPSAFSCARSGLELKVAVRPFVAFFAEAGVFIFLWHVTHCFYTFRRKDLINEMEDFGNLLAALGAGEFIPFKDSPGEIRRNWSVFFVQICGPLKLTKLRISRQRE